MPDIACGVKHSSILLKGDKVKEEKGNGSMRRATSARGRLALGRCINIFSKDRFVLSATWKSTKTP